MNQLKDEIRSWSMLSLARLCIVIGAQDNKKNEFLINVLVIVLIYIGTISRPTKKQIIHFSVSCWKLVFNVINNKNCSFIE
jgi:hypothetical protein